MTKEDSAYFSEIYERYADDLYRMCLIYLKNKYDAEEAVSEAFIRLMENKPAFENKAHEKAWLMKTAVNWCRNMQKSSWARRVVSDDEVLQYMTCEEETSIMEEVLALPPKYRMILYLHYYQGYKAGEISEMTGLKQSTVLSRLARGRKKLKDILIEGGFSYV